MHIAEPERDRLRREIAMLGGASTLLHYADSPETGIEITKAHPGSLPQFITGRSTLLSNLFRDEVALRTARIAAERLTAKNVELRTARGSRCGAPRRRARLLANRRTVVHGPRTAASSRDPPSSRRLRAQAARRLHGQSRTRARTAHALRDRDRWGGPCSARLRRRRLQAAAGHRSPAGPHGVRSRPSPSSRAWSSRASPTSAARWRATPRTSTTSILNALAGHHGDREALTIRREAPALTNPDERAPASDLLLLDADAEQERVLARITAGQSLAIHTLPGTGGTQTVINAVGALVKDGKRVLVVSARRSTLEGVRHRLASIGLAGLACLAARSAARPHSGDHAQREGRSSPRSPTSTMRSCAFAACSATIAAPSRAGTRPSASRSSTSSARSRASRPASRLSRPPHASTSALWKRSHADDRMPRPPSRPPRASASSRWVRGSRPGTA